MDTKNLILKDAIQKILKRMAPSKDPNKVLTNINPVTEKSLLDEIIESLSKNPSESDIQKAITGCLIDRLCNPDNAPVRYQNTKMAYLYRSNSNYKNHNEIIVRGIITQQQVKEILSCTIDGENFIPEKIHLPLERGWEYEEDEDNDYGELDKDSFSLTNEPVTENNICVEELVRAFKDAKAANWETYL